MPRLREPVKTLKKEELFEAPPPEKEKPEDKVEAIAPEPPKPEVKEPEQDEASVALQKQIEKLRESEALVARYQKERDEAIKQAREREIELAKQERKAVQSDYEAVRVALRAAKEKLEFAERDLRAAKTNGDMDAEIEATKRMTQANAEIMTLEPGVDELKDKRRAEKKKVRELRDQAQQPEQSQRPEAAPHVVEWTQAHREYFDGGTKQNRMFSAYYKAAEEGYAPYSVEMLARIDEILGQRAPAQEPERTNRIVSAPVSREVPSGGGRQSGQIRLTPDQREFARISGITEAEYAKQLAKLNELKASGDERYGGQR